MCDLRVAWLVRRSNSEGSVQKLYLEAVLKTKGGKTP